MRRAVCAAASSSRCTDLTGAVHLRTYTVTYGTYRIRRGGAPHTGTHPVMRESHGKVIATIYAQSHMYMYGPHFVSSALRDAHTPIPINSTNCAGTAAAPGRPTRGRKAKCIYTDLTVHVLCTAAACASCDPPLMAWPFDGVGCARAACAMSECSRPVLVTCHNLCAHWT